MFRTVTEHRTGEDAPDVSDHRASQRVSALPTSELIPQAEASLYAIGRALSNYQRSGVGDWVADAALEGDTLQVLLAELGRRVK